MQWGLLKENFMKKKCKKEGDKYTQLYIWEMWSLKLYIIYYEFISTKLFLHFDEAVFWSFVILEDALGYKKKS